MDGVKVDEDSAVSEVNSAWSEDGSWKGVQYASASKGRKLGELDSKEDMTW